MSALEARNRLSHGFFERHNLKIQTEDGRRKMIADLDCLHRELFLAWRTASDLSTIIVDVVERGGEGVSHNA